MDSVELSTARLRLRRLTVSDRPALLALLDDYDVVKNLSRWPHPVQPQMVDDLIARHKTDAPGGFAILYGDEFAGLISEGEGIGYMLDRRFWGLGVMTEALAAIQRHSMSTLGFEALHSGAFTDNPASIRVLEKCGWREVPSDPEYSCARGVNVAHRGFVKCARYDWLDPVETERLVLRPCGPQDFEAVWDIVSDKEIANAVLWPWPADEKVTRDRISGAKAHAGLISAVTLDGETIGRVSATKGEIGFMFRRAFWGNGYATEAVRAKIAQAFASPSVGRLTAGTWEENAGSLRILENCGFKKVGWSKVFSPVQGADLEGPNLELTRDRWEAQQ